MIDSEGDGPATDAFMEALGAGEYSRTVVLSTTATVSGTARLGGAAAAGDHGGITISLLGTSIATTTDASRVFTLADVPADAPSRTYRLAAAKTGYLTQELTLVLAPTEVVVLGEPIVLPEIDVTPPTDMAVTIEDGSGIIRDPSAWIHVSGRGASEMKVGTTSGLATAAWQPLATAFVWDFTPEDGTKRLFLRFRDAAGNESVEIVAEAELDTQATVTGTVLLAGRSDHAGVEVALQGTSIAATTTAAGAFTLADVPVAWPTGVYLLEAAKAGYSPATVTVVVEPAQAFSLAAPLVMLEIDDTPPTDMAVTIEDGSGVIRDPSAWIHVTGSGATAMKVGTTSGLANAAWQPLVTDFVWDLAPEDGTKRLYLRFRDAVGKEIGEIVAEAELDTEGALSGTVVLVGTSDCGAVLVALLGTSLSTTTDALGAWSIADVPGGTYNIEFGQPGFRTHRENGFYVVPAEANDVGEVVLDAFQARVVGQVVLEGWEGTLNHAGAQVVLPHPTKPGVVFEDYTDATGTFTLDVEPTNYPERLSIGKDGFATYEHPTSFAVGPDDTFNIGVVRLDATANDLIGHVRLAGRSDHSGSTVTMAGLNGQATEGELFTTSIDVTGDYELAGLPIGPYRVAYEYESEAHRETYAADVEIAPGPPTIFDPITLRDRYLTLAGGADLTASPLVTVNLGASDCLEQRVTNTLASFDDPAWGWGACVETLTTWDFGVGDGPKTVYAQFKVESDPANPTDTVSDTITLDTMGSIASFAHDGAGRALGKGAVLHLTLVDESGARAWGVISGYDSNVLLYDDGTRGDDPTTGFVHWGLDAAYGTDEASPTLSTTHRVTFGVGVLEPGTTYHFSVEALDQGGNDSATNDATLALVPSRPAYVVAIPGIGRAHVRWEASSRAPLRGVPRLSRHDPRRPAHPDQRRALRLRIDGSRVQRRGMDLRGPYGRSGYHVLLPRARRGSRGQRGARLGGNEHDPLRGDARAHRRAGGLRGRDRVERVRQPLPDDRGGGDREEQPGEHSCHRALDDRAGRRVPRDQRPQTRPHCQLG
ncbi:MAG: carboxypeptidase regulatory-like domain-containing protein [Polyangiaceae bacterium]|nr:carboxypeptidase regulatory-like domain-containing protein [Polyangiaceae bacterium]